MSNSCMSTSERFRDKELIYRRKAQLINSAVNFLLLIPHPPPAYRNKHFAEAYNEFEVGSDQSAVRSSFGCVLLLNQIYLTVRQYHSDLSDQSAMEIRDIRVALFSHFSR